MKRFILIVLAATVLFSGAVYAQEEIISITLPTGQSVQIICDGESVGFFVQKNMTNTTVSCLAVLPTATPEIVLPTATPTSPVVPTETPTSDVAPLPSVTPLPTETEAPTALPTVIWTPTITPTAVPISTATFTPVPPTATPTVQPTATQTPSSGITYYVSLSGADGNSGKLLSSPFRTFQKAMQSVAPGDTVLIDDGVYNQKLQPITNGTQSKPIVIRAINDGKVVINGGGNSIPVDLQKNWYILDGLVVRNGFENVLKITGQHNVVKRSTFYDADTNWNSQVVLVWGDYNTLEDIAAGGTGRYMIDVYSSSNNVVRRAFAMWRSWDGKNFCGVQWPNGNNIGVYNSNHTIIENSIAYGRSLTGIFYQANDDSTSANGNKILGSIAVLQGKDYDGTAWDFGTGEYQPTSRPGPTVNPYGAPCDNNVLYWEWGYSRAGFSAWGQGEVKDNIVADSIFVDNEGVGVSYGQPYDAGAKSNNQTVRVTSRDNWDAGYPWWEGNWKAGYPNMGNLYIGMGGVNDPTDSKIAKSPYNNGQGARIPVMRYENGVLTSAPLKPWPMEQRILTEMGVSVNAVIDASTANAQGNNIPYPIPTGGTMLPAP